MSHVGTIMWLVTLLGFGIFAANAGAQDDAWWRTSTIYQIYPRSFKDSDGDGIGDLKGITSKLQYIKNIGVDALWLSPIYTSPQVDFGYDIANFTDVDPIFGNLDDFKELVSESKKLDLRVILDFVPNHSSDQHPWFLKSIDRVPPYDDYYIWRNATVGPNNTRLPPSNWLSEFGKSAWEWNEKRQQYYYHAFAVGQPDLNYRNPALKEEMENALRFWLRLGVDGFRVDAVWHMYETVEIQDEPRSNNDVPSDDYGYLDHPYTRDLPENPGLIGEWKKVLDEFPGDDKPLILENYNSPFSILTDYYSNKTVPFNFMFISDIHKDSTPADYKKLIETWLNMVPEDEVTNWVVGNHDNHRAASRFGVYRADQINMITAMLPGIQVIYNGDEIGMLDRPFTYNETVDPPGIIAGPERYHLKTRDPERTPFQWDDSTSAGFSTNSTTWLPVNSNYKTLNLKAQEQANVSHLKVFQDLTELKKISTLKYGSLVLLEKDNVLAVIRKYGETVLLLINFNIQHVTIDARNWLNLPSDMKVYTSSIQSGLKKNTILDTTKISLRPLASVILQS